MKKYKFKIFRESYEVSRTKVSFSSKPQTPFQVLFTKLFVIMGISWLSECIHFELHGDHKSLKECNMLSEVTNYSFNKRKKLIQKYFYSNKRKKLRQIIFVKNGTYVRQHYIVKMNGTRYSE
jgi:hypothetical protein